MAVGPWVLHESFVEAEGDGTMDMDDDVFKLRLYSSASNVNDVTVGAASSVTNELSTANGYTNGGITLTTTWTRAAGVVTFGISSVNFLVSSANLVARYAAVVDTTADVVVAHMLLDSTPADVVIEPGASFEMAWPSGLFTKQAA